MVISNPINMGKIDSTGTPNENPQTEAQYPHEIPTYNNNNKGVLQ